MVLPDHPFALSGDGRPSATGRRTVLASLLGLAAGFNARTSEAQTAPADTSVPQPAASGEDPYSSPYSLSFASGGAQLDAGFDQRPWNDPGAESAQPVAAWQAAHARHPDGSWPKGAGWGPAAAQYPAPNLPKTDPAYLRERVIAVAARQIGLAYQHHHIPSWVPPAGWAWRPVVAGADGPGLDCSNFTSFVFNYALGIRLPTGIGLQAETLTLPGPGGTGCLHAGRIILGRYSGLRARLAPADLIYIHGRQAGIGHVVMWLGKIGQSADGVPLVIDCTETGLRDASGALIPAGVRLRPFRRGGWYWRRASHAHRIIGAGAPGCEAAPGPFPEGGDPE
jgi:cell wall-associated NlpC family hydrolase